jgi:hypothetical protein
MKDTNDSEAILYALISKKQTTKTPQNARKAN